MHSELAACSLTVISVTLCTRFENSCIQSAAAKKCLFNTTAYVTLTKCNSTIIIFLIYDIQGWMDVTRGVTQAQVAVHIVYDILCFFMWRTVLKYSGGQYSS